jgi:cell division cycle 14
MIALTWTLLPAVNMHMQMGIFQVIYLNRTADEAFKPLSAFKPFVPFRDASCGVSTFHLTVLDVIKVGPSGEERC